MFYEKFKKARFEYCIIINEEYFIQKASTNDNLIKHLTRILNNKNMLFLENNEHRETAEKMKEGNKGEFNSKFLVLTKIGRNYP